jgi:hypothetical protein
MTHLPADFPQLPAEDASLARLIAWFCEVLTWLVAQAPGWWESCKVEGETGRPESADPAPPPRTGSPDNGRNEEPVSAGREASRGRRAASPQEETENTTAQAAPARETEAPSPPLTRRPTPPRHTPELRTARSRQAPNARRRQRPTTPAQASHPRSTEDPQIRGSGQRRLRTLISLLCRNDRNVRGRFQANPLRTSRPSVRGDVPSGRSPDPNAAAEIHARCRTCR